MSLSFPLPEGYRVVFRRRRYGRTTYTWGYIAVDATGECHQFAGDPWPCVTPKRSEVLEAARETIDRIRSEHAIAISGEHACAI